MFKKLQAEISKANIRKTIEYCKKNGLCNTFYAIWEKTSRKGENEYLYFTVSKETLEKQRNESRIWGSDKFSILVPAYETKQKYLKEMIESVLQQSYENWEIIIADASKSDIVYDVVKSYKDSRIRYQRIKENKGISANSNEALKLAEGEFVALLDHDDVLTLDAVYELAVSIKKRREEGKETALIYSDEDKMNGEGTQFFEPHKKEKFNLDLFLSNNYICHFTAMRSDVIKKLCFRQEYDGAQDYDLFLRVVSFLNDKDETMIVHVPKVLYHWRCHLASTSENPTSKRYAYEAGRKAVENFCNGKGWQVEVLHTMHLGFYRINYKESIFENRSNVAAVGGPSFRNGKICAGAMRKNGELVYGGLPKHFSGYMHKASLQQQVEVLTSNNMMVKKECKQIFEDILKLYEGVEASNHKENIRRQQKVSIEFARKIKQSGYVLCYDPYFEAKEKR